MAKVTRIKASDPGKPKDKPKGNHHSASEPSVKAAKLDKKAAKRKLKAERRAEKKAHKKPMPKWLKVLTWPFRMILKPFFALGRYIRDSWAEIRQVRWPSRAATWKMVLAVLVYAGLFIVLIMLLDALFTWLFNLLLG